MTKSNYTAESIQTLDGLDHIRKRSGMYVGGISLVGGTVPGLQRLEKEIVDNVCDEFLAGHNDTLTLIYSSKTNVTTVIDHGRGIPTDKRKDGSYAITAAVSKLNSGGKFNTNVYKVSSGLNGVGLKAVNALSSHFQVWSNSGKGWFTQKFSEGKEKSKVFKEEPKAYKKYLGNTGVVIEYLPDTKIFKDTIRLNISKAKKELQDIQYLCPGLKIKLIIDNVITKYESKEGLKDMVYRDSILGKPFLYNSDNLDVALNWTNEEGTTLNSFVNISCTSEGGTHLDGLRRAVLKCLREYTDEKVEVDDLLEGLVGAIHYRVSNPVYTGQTKDKLTNADATKDVESQLVPKLQKYFAKNPSVTNRIIKYAEKMLKERSKLKDSKDLFKASDALAKEIKNIPDKFTDANRKGYKTEDLELYIVEGDSAGGNANRAREPYQGFLRVRGKMINCCRASANQTIGNAKGGGNKEIRDLVTVLGCGLLSKYDEKKLRFGKIILCADSDVDGSHIANLALTFICTYMPDLIKNGHVYYVDAPLFVAVSNNARVHGMTRNEVENKMKKKGISKFDILRLKGWGECLKISERVLTDRGFLRLKDIIKGYNVGWSDFKGTLKVLDKNGDYQRIKRIFVKENADTFKISTFSGDIIGTANHKLLVLRGCSLKYVPIEELKVGDYVAKCRKPMKDFVKNIHVPLSIDNIRETCYDYSKELTPEFCRFLGNYVANGYGRGLIINKKYKDIIKDIVNSFNNTFSVIGNKAIYYKDSIKNACNMTIPLTDLIKRYLNKLGYNLNWTSHTKDIPNKIFSSDKELLKNFIRGLIEGDGYFCSDPNYLNIEYSTASKKLAYSVAMALNLFGVRAFIVRKQAANSGRVYNHYQYYITLFGKDLDDYIENIGVFSKDKTSAFMKAWKNHPKRNSNNDVVPGFKEALIKKLNKISIAPSQGVFNVDGNIIRFPIKGTVAKDFTLQYLHSSNYINKLSKILPKEADTLRTIVNSNMYFDKVLSIKYAGKHKVADLEVENTHNYVANGFYTHNCTAEQFSELCLNPETRKLVKLELDENGLSTVDKVMGNDVSIRKNLLGLNRE